MRSIAADDPRVALVVLVAVVLVAGIGTTGGLPALEPGADGGEDPPTTWAVDLRDDGDARVTITMRFRLATANDTRAFERLAAEFENGSTTVLSPTPFERAASLASGETNRSMGIGDVERAAAADGDAGRLVLSFTWSNFARTAGDRIVVGDVFRTPGGTWLPRLTDRQEMVIEYPAQYAPASLTWPIRNGSVFIEGPVELAPGEPSMTFEAVSPNLSIRAATLDRDRIRAGESANVTATVENTGREAGTTTVGLRVDGETVETRTTSVGPERSETVTFTRVFEETGTFAVSVNDTAAGTLAVEEPPANPSVRSAALDRDRIRPGETATIRTTVANDGGQSGALPLELSANGSVVATEVVTVAANESRAVNLSHAFEEPGRFRIAVNGVEAGTLSVAEATPTPTPTTRPGTTDSPTSPPPTTSPGPTNPSEFGPLVGLVAVIALFGALAYFVRNERGGIAGALSSSDGDDGPRGGAASDTGGADTASATEGAGGDTPSDPTGSAAGSTASAAAAGGASEGGAGAGAPLLSDEERVLALLRENGGRMKQADIVDATDWSNAKVSQLLSGMADDGAVEKLRIGRENLITLPEEVPDGVG